MKDWPASLRPLKGCQVLIDSGTKKAYEMPIRPVPTVSEAGVKDHDNPQEWYDFAFNNELLSKSEIVACLQRPVILDQQNPGWWYTLGCHYELEGTDWYGATNAFYHVVFLNPLSGAAWFSLSQLWAASGVMTKARECDYRFRNPSAAAPSKTKREFCRRCGGKLIPIDPPYSYDPAKGIPPGFDVKCEVCGRHDWSNPRKV